MKRLCYADAHQNKETLENMSRVVQPKGQRGSLRAIQQVINESPEFLVDAIQRQAPRFKAKGIEWVSPLSEEAWYAVLHVVRHMLGLKKGHPLAPYILDVCIDTKS